MAWKTDDAVLLLGLGTQGVLTVAAVQAVSYALRDTLRLTQIHEEPQKQITVISQDTEDALNAQSLAVLAQGHDRQTRQAAYRILADRFIRDADQVTSLMRDKCSPDPEKRARAAELCSFLEAHSSDAGPIRFLAQFPLDASALVHRPNTYNGDHPIQARGREDSFEEQELRRRRREAVVFHDGGGPVSQEDIIQRRENGTLRVTRAMTPETRMFEDALRQLTASTG